jgi:hypothetical protein
VKLGFEPPPSRKLESLTIRVPPDIMWELRRAAADLKVIREGPRKKQDIAAAPRDWLDHNKPKG